MFGDVLAHTQEKVIGAKGDGKRDNFQDFFSGIFQKATTTKNDVQKWTSPVLVFLALLSTKMNILLHVYIILKTVSNFVLKCPAKISQTTTNLRH